MLTKVQSINQQHVICHCHLSLSLSYDILLDLVTWPLVYSPHVVGEHMWWLHPLFIIIVPTFDTRILTLQMCSIALNMENFQELQNYNFISFSEDITSIHGSVQNTNTKQNTSKEISTFAPHEFASICKLSEETNDIKIFCLGGHTTENPKMNQSGNKVSNVYVLGTVRPSKVRKT